ncbi:MAG: DoxX family protein [Parcubacteria group bacterium]|nr:DoxX family protein [Parcubacteria group bacterium]
MYISGYAAYGDVGLLVLRVVLGVIMLVHGVPKIKNFQGVSQWLGSVGLKPGKFWNAVLIVTEVAGGAALVAGAYTQLAALLVAIDMVVAILLVDFKKGFKGGWEFNLALLAIAIALFSLGGGSIGVGWYFEIPY